MQNLRLSRRSKQTFISIPWTRLLVAGWLFNPHCSAQLTLPEEKLLNSCLCSASSCLDPYYNCIAEEKPAWGWGGWLTSLCSDLWILNMSRISRTAFWWSRVLFFIACFLMQYMNSYRAMFRCLMDALQRSLFVTIVHQYRMFLSYMIRKMRNDGKSSCHRGVSRYLTRGRYDDGYRCGRPALFHL